MEALSRTNPVLMIFEDAHWTDPTSLETFSRAVDRLRTHRVLLLVTFRPEFEPPWTGRPFVTSLTINRLAQRDIDESSTTSLATNICRRTSGRTSSSAPMAFRCLLRR